LFLQTVCHSKELELDQSFNGCVCHHDS